MENEISWRKMKVMKAMLVKRGGSTYNITVNGVYIDKKCENSEVRI